MQSSVSIFILAANYVVVFAVYCHINKILRRVMYVCLFMSVCVFVSPKYLW